MIETVHVIGRVISCNRWDHQRFGSHVGLEKRVDYVVLVSFPMQRMVVYEEFVQCSCRVTAARLSLGQ